MSLLLACFTILTLPVVGAFSSFHPECTTPDTRVNFMHGPNSRGTWEILWGSLFPIFACTWTIQHPNIPRQYGSHDGRFATTFKRKLESLQDDMLLFVITILAPEITIAVASCELVSACATRRRLKALCLREQNTSRASAMWSLSKVRYANMGGFVLTTETEPSNPCRDYIFLTASELVTLWDDQHLEHLPDIADSDLEDRSKSDLLLKFIAMAEVLWVITQISARASRGLTISPLEISVLAYAVCAIVTYFLYWDKPKNVRTPVRVPITPAQHQLISKVLKESRSRTMGINLYAEFLLPRDDPIRRDPGEDIHRPIGNFTALVSRDGSSLVTKAVGGVGYLALLLFAGIHLAAWNFDFPSRAELIVWRLATVYTVGFGPVALSVNMIVKHISVDLIVKKLRLMGKYSVAVRVSSSIYVLARLAIVVEAFRTLFYLPSDSYVPTWTSNIPHFS